jgi:hypothetical protein
MWGALFDERTGLSFIIKSQKVRSKSCYDRRSVGQSILVSSTHLGPKTRFLLSDSCGFVDVGRPLWREDGFVFYKYCCPLLRKSISGPSPAGLMPIFYWLRFETPRTWRARSPYLYPPGTGWSNYTPSTRFPFRRLLRLAGLRQRYSHQPPHRVLTKF